MLNQPPDDGRLEHFLLDIAPIRQSTTVSNLCGPTCAEMILRFYGIHLSQYDIGETICSMVPEYQNMHPSHGALDCEWPDHYRETYQPIMALFFDELGFVTETTRTAYDDETGLVTEERFDALMKHLRAGTPLVFHVEGHYMLAVGYDDTQAVLYYNDPADGMRHSVSYAKFRNRFSRWYKPDKLSWDGRFLAVWK